MKSNEIEFIDEITTQLTEDKYCENCFNEDLDKYITDKFGGIYCDNECMEQCWIDKDEECINNDLYEKIN